MEITKNLSEIVETCYKAGYERKRQQLKQQIEELQVYKLHTQEITVVDLSEVLELLEE